MAEAYKTCPRCKRTLLRAEWFYYRKNGARGMRWESRCKSCCSQLSGKAGPHYEENKARHREWYARNRDEQLEKTRLRQPVIYQRRIASGYLKEASRLQRELLTDGYVKQVLAHSRSDLTTEQITPELVALKREHLAIKRAKKLILNALKEQHENLKYAD